jgi:hypothetical protein
MPTRLPTTQLAAERDSIAKRAYRKPRQCRPKYPVTPVTILAFVVFTRMVPVPALRPISQEELRAAFNPSPPWRRQRPQGLITVKMRA